MANRSMNEWLSRVADGIPPTARQVPFAVGYFVTEDGDVWTTSYARPRRLRPWFTTRLRYPVVTLRVGGQYVRETVHRIVCTVYHGQRPSPGHEVRHLNGNAQDARAYNLTWGTHAENMADMIRHGTQGPTNHPERMSRGENHYLRRDPGRIRRGEQTGGVAKLTEADIRRIRQEAIAPGAKARLAREYGVSQGNIFNIVTMRTWKHVLEAT